MQKLVTTLAVAIVATLGTVSLANAETPTASELHESFATVEDGPAPGTLVGTDVPVTNHQYNDAAAPFVRDGFLSTAAPAAAEAGSYRIAQLDADVTRVGALFAFTPQSVIGGVLCLSIQSSSIAEGSPVPASPVHLIVSPTGWGVDVNTEAGTGVDFVAGGAFDQPLAADGSTLHRVEAKLDRTSRRLLLSLPDGSERTIAHEAFGLSGGHVYVEPFKSPGLPLAAQTDALVREWWASTAATTVAAPVPEVAPDATPATVRTPEVGTTRLDKPRRVRAHERGAKVVVRWQRVESAERYVVRCGKSSKVVAGRRAVVRAEASRCRVRAVGESESSRWSRTRVRA